MRRILFSLLLLSLLPLSLAALVWFSLESTSKVAVADSLSHHDVARARQIIANNDPRQLNSSNQRMLILEEKDLNLAANYLLKNIGTGGVQIELTPGRFNLQASIALPKNPIKPYLNLALTIDEKHGNANIVELHVGQISVPGRLAELIFFELIQNIFPSEDQRLFKDVIKDLSLSTGKLQITYEWKPELISEVKSRLISPQDKERIRSYYRKLAEITRQPELKKRPSAIQLMKPLFMHAQSRSKNGNPIIENRAALIVLAAYVVPGEFSTLMPKTSDLPMPRRFTLTLNQRKDFAEHFLLSAAIAATGDAILADAVGLYKEVADSKGKSGFSFTDLAADRAGTRFGETATASFGHAHKIQQLFSEGVKEGDFMPKVRDLPENMGEKDFKQRFGGIGGTGYQRLKKEIEQRIAACTLYK